MNSLIEQAAARLQQLKAAGIDVPQPDEPGAATAVAPHEAAAAAPEVVSHPARPAMPHYRPAGSPSSKRVEIDLVALAAAGFITPDAARTLTSDQFRVIKRPLISNALGLGAEMLKHGNLIMITSALAGEGKTYNSVNLAMSIAAELDHTVMLVDADVARPSVLRTLGLAPSPGLLDVLKGEAEFADVLLRTNVDKLSVLPAGSHHRQATELLASEAMNRLLDDMATRYRDRIIIFDSPPLLLTTEARALATHMGQIVMVVQAGRTTQADVQHALSTIESCPVRMLVLNRAAAEGAGTYGYGGYGGYGYGYGYGGDGRPGADAENRTDSAEAPQPGKAQ